MERVENSEAQYRWWPPSTPLKDTIGLDIEPGEGTASTSAAMSLNLAIGSTLPLQFNDIPHQHSFDLNSPLDTGGNNVAPPGFTPTTPNKDVNTEADQVQTLTVCQGASQESTLPSDIVDGTRIEGPSQGESQEVDLKTPQQKPKRRKHRPRIYIQVKKTPTKPVTSESVAPKRKYVKKNKFTTPSSQVNADPPTLDPQPSCRRALDFNTQEQQQCGSSTTPMCSTSAAAGEASGSKRKYPHPNMTGLLYNTDQTYQLWLNSQDTSNKRRQKLNTTQPPTMCSDHVYPVRQGFIDFITYKLKHLDINRTSDCDQDQNALVPYTSDTTIVPFKLTKARRPQPKVDLDEETTRVYRLLLQNINNQGIDGTDEDKRRWWEQERRVFRGRVESFVARMHLVQGDRRFSPWKGSIVDSVVGVFLTQNVSDHLSSSAFMSIAARYPIGSKSNDKALDEEGLDMILSQKSSDKDSEEIQNINVSPGIKTFDVSSIQEINFRSLDPSASYVVTYHDPSTTTETDSFAQYYIPTNYIASSQESVNSFQRPLAVESYERIGSYSEAEKLKNRLELNNLNDSSHRSENGQCEVGGASDQSTLTIEATSNGTAQEKVAMTIQESSTPYSEEEHLIQSQNSVVGDNKVQQTPRSQNLSGHIVESRTSDEEKAAEEVKEMNSMKQKSKRVGLEINKEFNWDALRREVEAKGKKERLPSTMDSVDWEAIRCADVKDIAETIKERGMNNILAERIKAFLNRVVKDHGSIDLEWLRDIEPDKAKEYLLSIHGLGLKSVECIRLLALQHHAFPVDTNVGRIAVRLGWVPLAPLPESLQLHLLEMYPIMDSIQKYLWPRLCKLNEKELYELHYQMITFGKVFCTKSRPNCNSCPMRGECRHFASAYASARRALPAPEQKPSDPDTAAPIDALPLLPPQATQHLEANLQLEASLGMNEKREVGPCEPIIEVPASPEPERTQYQEQDIEEFLYDDDDDPDDIPTINLNIEEFTNNLKYYMEANMELQEGDMSKALVALTPEKASIPMPKLKNESRLRTEHRVYELPDSHPILKMLDAREPDDPSSYLLAIWTPGETATSTQPPEGGCSCQESGKLCDQNTCVVCNSTREANSQTVRGTLLIPCRTAMRGRFPLNGTYFQVNEVFADHATSLNPIDIPREWLWNLPRRTVYFGTSVTSIFRGMSTEDVQLCFWRGHVCVRGMDRETRAPRPLMSRLHSALSKIQKPKK